MYREPLPVAEPWFRAEAAGDGVDRFTEPYVDPLLAANAWLVRGSDRDLLVDAGNGIAPIRPVVDRRRGDPGKPLVAIATHGHMDHAGGLHAFDDRGAHAAEAGAIAKIQPLLLRRDVWPSVVQTMAEAGYQTPDVLVTARPSPSFDPETFAPTGCALTRVLHEGDVLDLGDRAFEVLHLPGHTSGSIGLWDEASATLFTGDAVYLEDPLIDGTPSSSIDDYVRTMRRLRRIPARIVHAGHDRSFGREDLVSRCDAYLARRARV